MYTCVLAELSVGAASRVCVLFTCVVVGPKRRRGRLFNRDDDIAVKESTNHTKSMSDIGIGNIDLLLTFLSLPWGAPWELTILQPS